MKIEFPVKTVISHLFMFLFLSLSLSCKKETPGVDFTNPLINEETFSKIHYGMSASQVEAILGKPCLSNPFPRAGGLSSALPNDKKEMSSLWCDEWPKMGATIYCRFEDSILVKKEFGKNRTFEKLQQI